MTPGARPEIFEDASWQRVTRAAAIRARRVSGRRRWMARWIVACSTDDSCEQEVEGE
jgi:hypothetical protein